MKINKKLVLWGTVAIIFLLVPFQTHAQAGSLARSVVNSLIDFTATAVGKLFYVAAWIFSFIGGLFFALGAFFTRIGLEMNFRLMSPENTLLTIGWKIVRDMANLGFVLMIIVIAIATIIRYESYGNKKILTKLIAAAILVNFSLTIAGIFIDFSHVLTKFFFQKISTNPAEIASTLAGAFNPQKFFTPPPSDARDADIRGPNPLEALAVSSASLVFVVVFTALGALTMFATAAMLFLRYLWLTFLIILSPIVWLFWVIPALEGQWKKWWDKFFQWVFFAPAISFFIYLALLSAEGLRQTDPIYNAGNIFGGITGIVATVASTGAQMTVLVGILLGGLIAAQKMGITGATAAVKGATSMLSGVKDWASYRTGAAFKGSRAAGFVSKAATGLQKFSNWKPQGKFARYASAPFRAPLQGLAGGLATLAQGPKAKGKPTTLAGFMLKGALTGSGLWKKPSKKARGKTASGEDVEIDLPEEEGGEEEGDSKPATTPQPKSPLQEIDTEREQHGERQINL
ncbi:MAG TPA: hypothetical protein VNK70_02050 [Candidatus Paceibacterota bacterium]|nr:hypothetical protein [Candidatus Paceibacterota bacterium]